VVPIFFEVNEYMKCLKMNWILKKGTPRRSKKGQFSGVFV